MLMQNFWGQTRYIMGQVRTVHSVAPPPPLPNFAYVIVFKFPWDRAHAVFGWEKKVPRGIGKQRIDPFVSCVMTSFRYYDQNLSGLCFLVQIKAFVIQTSLGLPNLNMKGKTTRILVVVIK